MTERLDAEPLRVDVETTVEEGVGLGVVEVAAGDPGEQRRPAAGQHDEEHEHPDRRAPSEPSGHLDLGRVVDDVRIVPIARIGELSGRIERHAARIVPGSSTAESHRLRRRIRARRGSRSGSASRSEVV